MNQYFLESIILALSYKTLWSIICERATRGAQSGRSCEPSSQKIFNKTLIWQKNFGENQAIFVVFKKKQYNDTISTLTKNFCYKK